MLLVLLLLVLFLLVLLGFYVFVAAPRSRTHQTFTAFVLCLALWAVKDIALWGFSARDGSAARQMSRQTNQQTSPRHLTRAQVFSGTCHRHELFAMEL